MRRGIAVALWLVVLLCLAPPILAQDDDDDWDSDDGEELDRGRSGFYLSARGIYAWDDFKLPQFSKVNGVPVGGANREFNREGVDQSTGIDARLGYRLGPLLAVEGQFEWLKRFDVESRPVDRAQVFLVPDATGGVRPKNGTQPNRLAKIWGMAGTVNAKVFALTGVFQPYGIVGGGILYVESLPQSPFDQYYNSRYSTGPVVRGGVGFDLYGYGSDSTAITVESTYVAGLADVQDYRYLVVSAGFTWRW